LKFHPDYGSRLFLVAFNGVSENSAPNGSNGFEILSRLGGGSLKVEFAALVD
jgi:hypothetical protein